ncbi:Acyl-CoA synthetases (AMP-forming)/AMP-acid ligases II-like [Frankia casuarinae]|uniref:Acyl-CoA synthetases (AMP-forming)/AMP-acid ligases II-like n=1 Tax=Frankia casuarinae (strain DSM 45818 / CECT 9043 / HFP020203 / CcI3) TaxID=106370 RepID=Q2JC08_FRACC|nr:Acyl-CoA synthetases (AMP-forming)/AMP-acid ligases II-like [Frankia casuarinae]
MIDSGGACTFGQLGRDAHRLARDLGGEGGRGLLRPVTARSEADFLVEVFATWLAGGIPLPLSARGAAVSTPDFPRAPAGGCEPWKAIVGVCDGLYRPLVTHGEPPSVPRKALALGLRPDGRALIGSPLHLNGPFEFAVRQILLGGTVVICPVFTPQVWVTYAGRHRPTWAFLVPTQLRRLLDDAGETAVAKAASSVDRLVYSSQPCPPDLRGRLLALLGGDRLAEYYGTAEYDGTLRVGAADGGVPIDGAEIRITGPQRVPVPAGTVGTIEGRSRVGLASHPVPGACPPSGAWQSVGDRGHLDGTGRLHVASVAVPGRAIVGGVNVAVAQVRVVLAAHPAISDCTVSVVPDAVYGHRLTARACTRHPTLTAEEIHAYCATRLAAPERPSRLDLIRLSPSEATAHAVDL